MNRQDREFNERYREAVLLEKYGQLPAEVAVLIPLAPQADLPLGPTFRCSECGTRVRTGQPHSALEPWPHQTFAALTVAA